MVYITVHIKKVNTVIVLYKIINSKSNTGYDPYTSGVSYRIADK